MTSERKTVRLGDVASVKGGKRLPKGVNLITDPNDHPYIRVRDLNNKHTLELNTDFEYVDDETQKSIARYIVNFGDIILSIVGTIGLVAIVGESLHNANLTENCVKITQLDGVDRDYLYYFLKSEMGQAEIAKGTVGAVQAKLPIKNIQAIEVIFPNIEKQKKIASILSSIDYKIEVNEKINDNLQQQILAVLFSTLDANRSPLVKLGECLYIKGRIGWKGLKKSEYLEYSDYRIINGESLTLSGIDWNKAGFITKERYDESPEIMLQVGDILLSKDGTIGKIGYVDRLDSPTSVASGIFVIRNIQPDIISTQFIYYLLKSRLFAAFIASRTEGSVIPHLYQKDFSEFEFPLPGKETMQWFDDVTGPMFKQIFAILHENEVLIRLRDTLLPKLMSGEIDVTNIDI